MRRCQYLMQESSRIFLKGNTARLRYGGNPQIETAAKPESAIDKGIAGPGLLSYIVTSKFTDYLPCYRLEDIFARQGFEISRATQSAWCDDVGDLAQPLYELMGNEVRASHVVATDDTIMPMLKTGHCTPRRCRIHPDLNENRGSRKQA